MAGKSAYTVWLVDDSNYRISKFDEDFDPVDSYNIAEIGKSTMICTCPAGGRPTCRHRQMLRLFQGMGKVDSGLLYQFDTKLWFNTKGERVEV